MNMKLGLDSRLDSSVSTHTTEKRAMQNDKPSMPTVRHGIRRASGFFASESLPVLTKPLQMNVGCPKGTGDSRGEAPYMT